MKSEMDSIQFESRVEIQTLMEVIGKYIEQNPEEDGNEVIEEFFNFLDVMDMNW